MQATNLTGNRASRDGRIIPSQEASQNPGTLRSSIPRAHVPVRAVNGVALRQRNCSPPSNGETSVSGNGVHEDVIRERRKPNRRQRAWWNAVHDASNRCVSVRGIARELGMSRNTVRKYLAAEGPDLVGTIARSTPSSSVTIGNVTNGQNH